jgi:crotonobetainyl-CoA:carnitine CoA-transferase CaiB-like acyl-CoA transferase
MKLDGIRVLDLSLFLPGPWCTLVMADHGAEVIKLEPPGGEPTRAIGPRQGGEAVWFRNTHRGKKSITLDLKSEEGRADCLDIAASCDVVVEAFRPGVMQRLGLGPEVLAARNPRLVTCSISAFGADGPERDRPAHDLAVEALCGVLSLNLGQDGLPTHPHIPAADALAAALALSAILMALLRRERTGRGDHIDMAMSDATLAWLPNATGTFFSTGAPPEVKQERQWGGGSFYAIYATRDTKHVVLGGSEHKFVANLLTALGRPDLIEGASGPPGAGHDETKRFLSETFATRTRDEWEAWFAGRDVCFAPLLDQAEAFARPQGARMLWRDAAGNLHLGTPIRFRDEPARLDPQLPRFGEDTAEVIAEARRRLAR